MPLREFTDRTGTAWRVWETRPSIGRGTLRQEFIDGWLTFEQGTDTPEATRRRLAPIPDGWADLPDLELRRLCLDARLERPRQPLRPQSLEPPAAGDPSGA